MIDYHVHSDCSGDCSAAMIDVCRAAVARGVKAICFTEHLDFEPTDSCFNAFDYCLFMARIAEVRESMAGVIEIRAGIEVDFQSKFRAEISEFLADKDFDYVLGAAHYVNGVILEDHDRYFPGKSAEEAYTPYFDNSLAAVETGWFDALAHLDLCKRYGVRYYGALDWDPYRERIEQILRAVIEQGMALEINTSGLRQSPGETYPCRGMLELYYALGGRAIIVGSDSHRVEDVGGGIADALELAQSIGFDSVRVFADRQAAPIPITSLRR